jgi:hypothetical protein
VAVGGVQAQQPAARGAVPAGRGRGQEGAGLCWGWGLGGPLRRACICRLGGQATGLARRLGRL